MCWRGSHLVVRHCQKTRSTVNTIIPQRLRLAYLAHRRSRTSRTQPRIPIHRECSQPSLADHGCPMDDQHFSMPREERGRTERMVFFCE